MYWENIPGMFNFDNIYQSMVNKFNNAIFIEIGAWKGKSAVFMAEEIKKSGKNIEFYTIDLFEYTPEYNQYKKKGDNHSFYEEFMENINPLKDFIKPIKGKSFEEANNFQDNSIDFLFVDGDHSYKGVKKDLESWFPKIKNAGIIAGHDYTEPSCGVKMAVDQFFLFTGIEINRSSWIFNKKI